MTKKTLERRTSQLISEIMQHPHKQEIIKIMQEQLLDDANLVHQQEHLY